MKRSKNLDLWLPEGTDPLEVDRLSENFEALDGFAKLADPFKVGDILHTLRTDLGDDWLLCNGENFDLQKYPELAGMMPGLEMSVSSATVTAVGSPLSGTYYADSFATDGRTQLVTTARGRGNRQMIYLIQSNDNFKTHTSVSTITGLYARPFFVNGYWIIFFFDTDVAVGNAPRASYISAGDQPDGTRVQVPTNINIADVRHVEYINGKYYAFGTEQTYTGYKAIVLTSNSPNFANAAVSYADSPSPQNNQFPYSFLRTEDKFVFFRNVNSKLNSVTWSDKPDSGYQTRTVDQASQTTAGARAFQGYGKPLYADGKVFWAGVGGSSPSYKITVICLDGIESGGIRYVEVGTAKTGDVSFQIFRPTPDEYAIFCYDSASDSYLMVGTDPLDASTWKKCSLGTKGVNVSYQCLQYIGGNCLNAFTLDGNLCSVPIAAAPSISPNGCYAYIKAK